MGGCVDSGGLTLPPDQPFSHAHIATSNEYTDGGAFSVSMWLVLRDGHDDIRRQTMAAAGDLKYARLDPRHVPYDGSLEVLYTHPLGAGSDGGGGISILLGRAGRWAYSWEIVVVIMGNDFEIGATFEVDLMRDDRPAWSQLTATVAGIQIQLYMNGVEIPASESYNRQRLVCHTRGGSAPEGSLCRLPFFRMTHDPSDIDPSAVPANWQHACISGGHYLLPGGTAYQPRTSEPWCRTTAATGSTGESQWEDHDWGYCECQRAFPSVNATGVDHVVLSLAHDIYIGGPSPTRGAPLVPQFHKYSGGSKSFAGTIAMVQVYAFALSPSNIACVLETGLALVQTGRLQVTAAHQGACQGRRTTGCTNQVATNSPGSVTETADIDDMSCRYNQASDRWEAGTLEITSAWQFVPVRIPQQTAIMQTDKLR